jgi:transcriptional regulator with XRE-family HTH domain
MSLVKNPNFVDVHVGRRVRLRRKEMGITQQCLAVSIGLTFQQIQKYERGANRISASKLYEIAHVVSVPMGYFFLGLDDPVSLGDDVDINPWASMIEDLLAEPNGKVLAEAFLSIRSSKVRRELADFARIVAARDDLDEELEQRSAAE